MTPLLPDGVPVLNPDCSGYFQDFETPAGAWPDRVDGAVELLIWDNDGWIDKPAGEPSVAIGVSLKPEWYRPLAKNTEWVHRVRGAGFCFTEYDAWVCCYATIPLRDVVEKGGASLAEQAGYIASWAAPLARRLLSDEFDPGLVERLAKPRRG